MKMKRHLVSVLLAAGLFSCSSDPTYTPPDADAGGDPDAAPDIPWDVPTDDTSPEVLGNITGTVFSPASDLRYRFPIAQALVYLTRSEAPFIPRHVYCDKCVSLAPATPQAMTDSYGTFRIERIPEGEWNMVVQKGQFRRVRRITVYGGQSLDIPQDMTTLPNSYDEGSMDTIPMIAVASGAYDWFEDLLAKFGLADLESDYHYKRGTEEFTLFSNGGQAFGMGVEDFKEFLRRPLETPDVNDLHDFNVLFIPCTDGRHSDEVLSEPAVIENLRSFVQSGGKLYVADWSYDFLEQAFPEFIDFVGDDSIVGHAEQVIDDFWDTTGSIRNADLTSWLVALGHDPGSIEFLKSWVGVEATSVVPGIDEFGEPIDITPEEVINGTVPGYGDKPLNVVFNYGCGKVLYTTYHTIGALEVAPRPEMIPQEKILLYLILDISVCSDDIVIPI